MDEAEKLARLDELRAMGLLTDLDYVVHKARIEAETVAGEGDRPAGDPDADPA